MQITLVNVFTLLCNLMIKRIAKNINVFTTRKKMLFSFAILYQGWTNSFLGVRLFGRPILLARSIGHAKCGCSKPKCTSDRDTTRNIELCSLLPKQACSFNFNCVFIKIFAIGFCSLNVVPMCKIRCA